MRSSYDQLLHAFRGIAILCIVLMHGFGFMIHYAANEPPEIKVGIFYVLNEVLFHDGTIFFALISGLLFSYVLARKGWASFFRSKLVNVVFPYLFFTIIFTYFYWDSETELKMVIYSGDALGFFQKVFENFITGEAIFSFWYIPVLLVLYLLTPLLYTVIKTPRLQWLIIPLALMPLVTSRFWPEIVWTNFAFFVGVYTLGLYAGAHYPQILDKLNSHVYLLMAVAVITTMALVLMFKLKIDKWHFISLRESVWYVQKLAFASLILIFCKRYIEMVPSFIYTLGNYAFPIFFMHGFLMWSVYALLLWLNSQISSYLLILLSCVAMVVVVTLFCLLISRACQLVFKRWSRQIIGA